MVRTINEPLPTPIRPSPIASTSKARAPPPPSYPASRIPIRATTGSGPRSSSSSSKKVSNPAPRPSVVKKRAPLGEWRDNTSLPVVPVANNRKPRPVHIVVNPIPTSSSNSPSRPLVSPSIRGPAMSTRPPRPSFTRIDTGMDGDVTQLLDMRPSSPSGATTDDDWFSGAEEARNITAGRTPMPRKSNTGWGKAVEGRGRIMTPMNSQEIQTSAGKIDKSITIPRRVTTSRLPTPPSSQEAETNTTPQRPSPPNRRRARPSPTPPRRTFIDPDDTQDSAEPSPNPRSKKNPRLALRSFENSPESTNSPSASIPATAKGKGRPWAGTRKSFSPVNETYASPPPELSLSKSTRRKSTASTKKRPSPEISRRKSLASTPRSAMARYAGVDPRRKTMTPAALRRIIGQNLEFGAGVDSVESSPSDDPLLLRPLHDYDTEVNSDFETTRVSQKSTPRRSAQKKGSQTEPRGKGKGRASDAGLGFATSTKSKLTNTGSKKVATSFPFRPYSNLPAPSRKVPEWVPRTMKKKKVELEYDLDQPSTSQERDEEPDFGNGSFDYDVGGFADGFGSDGDSDRGGGGYEGDDTFMNILTRRDIDAASNKGKGVEMGERNQENSDEEEEEGSSFSQVKASGYSPAPSKARFMAIAPSSPIVLRSPMGDIDDYPSPPPSPPRQPMSPLPVLLHSPSGIRQTTPMSSPAHATPEAIDAEEGDHQDFGPSFDDYSFQPEQTPVQAREEDARSLIPSPVQLLRVADLPEVEIVQGEEQEGDMTEDMDTTMESEADITTDGIAESWDVSNSTIAEEALLQDAVGETQPVQKEAPGVYIDGMEEEALIKDTELDAILEACMAPSDIFGPSAFDQIPLRQSRSPILKSAEPVVTSPVVVSTVLTQTVEAITFSYHNAQPYSPKVIFSPHSPEGSPPSSPLRPSDDPPSTPSRRSKSIPTGLTLSPKITLIASPVQSPRQSQTFDESARSSLSSSQIDETIGNTTVEVIGDGWDSDESAIMPDASVEQNIIEQPGAGGEGDEPEEGSQEEEEISGLFAQDETADKEAEQEAEEINMLGSNPAGESDSVQASTQVTSVNNIVAELPSIEAATSDSVEINAAQASSPPKEAAASDGKIVISLIPRIVKIEPGEDDEDSDLSEESDEIEVEDSERETESEIESGSEESEDDMEDGEEDVKFGDAEDEEEEAINEASTSEDEGLNVDESTSEVEVPAQQTIPQGPVVYNVPSTPAQTHTPLSTTPLHTPPQSVMASQRAVSPMVQRSASPKQQSRPTVPASSVSVGMSTTIITNPAGRRQSGANHRPSGLSHQITGDTPESSPARPIGPTQGSSQAASSSNSPPRQLSESPFIEEGVSIRSAGKSLLAEMARASGKGKSKELRGVVEVSSLDPRAAARAAAILKLNHNYIEHGILPSDSKSRSGSTSSHNTKSASPGKSLHSRRKSYTSHHFDSVASAQKLSPEELLNEAELEIVVNEPESIVGTPARKRREGTAISAMSGISGITDLPVPGGWVRTPKRKRSRQLETTAEEAQKTTLASTGKTWGIKEWKRLESVYRAEKDAWVKEREVRPMPGGLMAWARRSTLGRPSEEVVPWDEGRVVRRFLEIEGVEKGVEGAWAEDVILLRIQALERRLATKSTSSTEKTLDESPNKLAKVASIPFSTPNKTTFGSAKTVPAPNTMKRVMGWMWGSSIAVSGKKPAGEKEEFERVDKGKGRAEGERPDILPLGKPIGQRPVLPITTWQTDTSRSMKQVSARPITAAHLGPPPRSSLPRLSGRAVVNSPSLIAPPAAVPTTSALPKSAARAVPPLALTSLAGNTSLDTSLLGLSTSSSATSMTFPPQTPRIYPSLNQSISQRSAAIKALFPTIHPLCDSTSSTISSSSVGNTTGRTDTSFSSIGLSRKTSVKDLAKNFEEKGVLDNALRRVPSGQNELDKLKRIRSREER